MKRISDPMQICLASGIKVYPVYQYKDVYHNRKLVYQKDHWYLEVDNNGKVTRYGKSVGSGKTLRGKAWMEAIDKTYIHWMNKLEEVKR